MAYLDASTNEGIAEFLADFNLEIRHEEPGDQIGHVKYSCALTERDQSFYTFYQHNPDAHGKPTVADVMYALASDAMKAVDYEIDDFADMGFTKPSEAIRAYEGCQKALNWFKNDLEINIRSLNKLELALDENLDEIKEAVQKLVADRQAKYEYAHPEPPEGFVTIEDLQKDLDLGDYGDQIEPGCYDYISDAFSDCADSNVDIYYSQMFKWLPDNYGWIAAAKSEGLLEGVEGDLIKMIQSAQYLAISQNLYEHQDDILKNLVLESLKEDGLYVLSEDAVDDILDGCDGSSTDRLDILIDKAKDVISDFLEEGEPIAMSVEEVRVAHGKDAKAVSSLAERCNGAKEASQGLDNHDTKDEPCHDTNIR